MEGFSRWTRTNRSRKRCRSVSCGYKLCAGSSLFLAWLSLMVVVPLAFGLTLNFAAAADAALSPRCSLTR
eukprot:scaffold4929_cov176-Amphora_coffeaeformis.AAC.2